MQIHELSMLTGINPETIRSYRLKGLIHPVQKDNGYYDYTVACLIELTYIRKMREYEIPLYKIQKIYEETDVSQIYDVLDEEIRDIQLQIKSLNNRLRFLEFEKSHIEESTVAFQQKVSVMESVDDKIDYYDLSDVAQLQPSSDFYLSQTAVICISREILNCPIEDRIIPIKAGIGTYRFMLEERNIPVTKDAAIIPNGKHLSMMIAVTDLEHMNLMQIAPMMQYAKDHHLTFLSDTTGYIARVEVRDGKPLYHFRIRACIEIHPRTEKAERASQTH